MKVDRRYYNKLCRTECIRNSRRVFRLPRRSIKDASVARFVNLKSPQHKLNSGENPRKGAAAPFLVVLRGLQRGKAPTRIQRSDSCGKRRNNGTDDACPPQAAGGMRDVEFVPTQIPLDWFPFHRQRPFPLTSKEKGAECRSYGSIPFKKDCWRQLRSKQEHFEC